MAVFFKQPNTPLTYLLTCLLALLATGAAASPQTAVVTAFSQSIGGNLPAPWRFVGLPERYAKPASVFDIADIDGKKVLRVRTDASWGSVVHPVTGPANVLEFSWRLDKPLMRSSLTAKATEDAALKVCLSFDMPIDNVPTGERLLLKLAQRFSRDKLPTAMLCYTWAYTDSVGSVVASPVTGRVRYWVLNAAADPLRAWQPHTRNVGADFLKAFGAESPFIPAVVAIVIGADADNTQDTSLGYVGDVTLGVGQP